MALWKRAHKPIVSAELSVPPAVAISFYTTFKLGFLALKERDSIAQRLALGGNATLAEPCKGETTGFRPYRA